MSGAGSEQKTKRSWPKIESGSRAEQRAREKSVERARSEERGRSLSGYRAVRGLNWLLKFRSNVMLLKLRNKYIINFQRCKCCDYLRNCEIVP